MPHKLEWGNNYCVFNFRDVVDSSELLNIAGNLVGESAFNSLNYVILNFRNIAELRITEQDIKLITSFDKHSTRWNRYLKLAFITSDDFTKRMAGEYKKLMGQTNWNIRIFTTYDEAINWCTGE